MIKTSLIIYLLIFSAGFSTCGKPGKTVSFNEVCSRESRTQIEIEGYLRLPNSTEENDNLSPNLTSSRLLLTENANGAGEFLYTLIDEAKTPAPNRMGVLPESYTYADLHIFSNEGKELSPGERVRVTGEIIKEKNLCVLKIEKIETR